MSSGWFCRSPSIVTTISPRARARPACIAGCWPKLRLKRTACTRGSAACSRSTAAHVPSVDPSSTRISSNALPPRSIERRYGAPVELLDRAFLVQERDDDGEIGIGHERQGAYRRSLARRASRPGVARAGLPCRRGVRRHDRALDASRDSHLPPGRPGGPAHSHPDGGLGARAGRELDAGRSRSRPPRSRALDLRVLAGRGVRALVRQLRAAAAADPGRLRHLRREARPDRPARRDPSLEGRGRARAGSGARAARPRGRPGRGGRVLEEWPFPTGWEDWRPDPSWPIPQLPDGWDRV